MEQNPRPSTSPAVDKYHGFSSTLPSYPVSRPRKPYRPSEIRTSPLPAGRRRKAPPAALQRKRCASSRKSKPERIEADIIRCPPRACANRSGLEVVLHADRKALYLASGVAVAGRVVAVGRDAMPARAEVVVRPILIVLAGIYRIPVGLPVEVMLVAEGQHVRLVVERPVGRAGRLAGVRPADVHVIVRRDLLRRGEPEAAALPLVEVGDRSVTRHPLDDEVERRVGRQAVLDAHLESLLVADADCRPISGAIHVCMLFVRGDQIGRARLVNAGDAQRVAVGAIVATVYRVRAIAAGAVRFPAGGDRVVGGPVLAGREQRIDPEAADAWRFIPRGVRESGVELRAIVAASVAHD